MTGQKRVLVTRALQDAPVLARRLAETGFEPVLVPLLEIRWDALAIADAAQRHPHVDRVLITSSVAADVVAAGAPSAWRDAQWAAVGPATADRLARHGYACATVPDRATADELVRTLGEVAGQSVLLPRSELADPGMVRTLTERGASVLEVVAYTNVAPTGFAQKLRASLPVDATTLMSGSAAERLAEGVPVDERPLLGKIVAVGPTTAHAAGRRGIPVDGIADPHTVDGLVTAVLLALGGR